jgi:hypothetical protein
MLVMFVTYIFCLFGWNVKKQIKRLFLVTLPSVAPSVMVMKLGKVTISGHLGRSFAECQTFAECHDHDTRQRF